MQLLKYFLLSLLFLSACDKFEWHNPYDPECPKELFTPSSPGATMEGNSVKLTWSQSNDDISGFALFRSAEGEPIANLTQTQKSATQYLDASVTPGKKYIYYVLAVAGTNKSDTIKAEITPVFPITISTGTVTELAPTSAKVSGNITSAGGGTVSSRGICWSTTQNPTVNNSKTTEGTGAGQYTSTLSGLLAATTYYARAYGENSRGIVYGSQVTFTTLGPPTLTTTAVSNITATSATSGGTILSDGGTPITAKGVVWSTSPNPTIALSTKTDDGTGVGAFTSTLSNLTNNTRYYIRSYATNIVGTSYGEEQSFTTSTPAPPILESLTQGLVAYYPFNGNANDESGNGNNGTVNGSPRLSEDRFGKSLSAYNFSQKSDYIKSSNFNLISGNQSRTYSFWAKMPIGSEGGYCLSYGPELFLQGASCNVGNHIDLNQSSAADCAIVGIGFGINCNQIRKPIQINDGLWHHIIIMYNGVNGFNGLQFYIDGKLLLSTGCPQGSASAFNTHSINYGLTIGRRVDADNYTSSLVTFKGDLDDIRIYNRALTQEEITYLANN